MSKSHPSLFAGASALSLALTGCGGGGAGGVAFIPAPPPTNTPTPTPTPSTAPTPGIIISSLGASQEFARAGAEVDTPSSDAGTLTLGDASQPRIRYDASLNQYQVQLPNDSTWSALQSSDGGGPQNYALPGPAYVNFDQSAVTGYTYSALARWVHGISYGSIAIGIPTPEGSVPVTGTATYDGQLSGHSTETVNDAWGPYPVSIGGKISLAFDFGAGTLAGSISPTHEIYDVRTLPTLNFTDTVYSTGSNAFSGKFATALTGQNSFSGQFTGPSAQELIGRFAFPYASPLDGKIYQAGGAFVGRRP